MENNILNNLGKLTDAATSSHEDITYFAEIIRGGLPEEDRKTFDKNLAKLNMNKPLEELAKLKKELSDKLTNHFK